MTKVINILSGPSAGKSTQAHFTMAYMKKRRKLVKFVSEVADERIWQSESDGDYLLDDQIAIFGEQHRRVYTMYGKSDLEYIVMESPLLLSAAYHRFNQKKFAYNKAFWDEAFERMVVMSFLQYDNMNYFLDRGALEYDERGRGQDLEAAIEIDNIILALLKKYNIPYKTIHSYATILSQVGINLKQGE